ncbi:hypothetical protein [Shewanella algae]|uniref:hypothetical protein n=1 Tax=Shewanella algae TaxID=38313 RepID=UPI000D14F787|nr:hypothetical protein [Shewanella algae]PST67109.1 hypothetical protein AYI77_10175 [Shewanella algae]
MNHQHTDPDQQLIIETATALGMDNPSEQMLLEFTSLPSTPTNVIPFQQSSTTSRKADGLTRIEGIFIHNDPKRFEPGALADAVAAFQNQIKSHQALGSLRGSEFKASPVVDPSTAAIVIERLELNKEGHAIGVAAVCSKKLEALLRVGWIPAVMIRGLGRINEKRQTRKGCRLTALDVGWTGIGAAVTATLGSGTAINEQVDETLTEQQQEPAAEPATPSKQRLISPELIAEKFEQKFEQKKLNENRMREWISSVRNNTDFK